MKKERRPFSVLIAVLISTSVGCTVGPNYHPPETKLPSAYGEKEKSKGEENGSLANADFAHWWQVFRDPELDSLIQRATLGNRDLKQALSRVRQARAERAAIAANLRPQVDATANYTRSVTSHNGPGVIGGGASSARSGGNGGGSSSGGASGTTGSAGGGAPGTTMNLYQLGFDALWEIDIFGGTRRAIEAADYGIGAAEE